MRKFNAEVFNETVEGTTERFSGAQFNDMLGSADKLVVQYRALKVSGTSPTLTLKVYGSNNGTDWVLLDTLVNGGVLTAGSVNTNIIAPASSTQLAAFVRFGVTLGGTSPAAAIEVIACGRDGS